MISETHTTEVTDLEAHFNQFRKHIIGKDQTFISPYGEQKMGLLLRIRILRQRFLVQQ